ncbi:MAG: hypothetical protein NWE90_04915 [Candidatus Bathyarchaeota archaeon]|nr:hypothetical protein [Candidatus Bathyarchaeota archaeon]
MTEEKLPISEKLTVLKAETLYKTEKWWSAIALVETFGRKQIATYLWLRKDDEWKRKQKFVIRSKKEWHDAKEVIEEMIEELK